MITFRTEVKVLMKEGVPLIDSIANGDVIEIEIAADGVENDLIIRSMGSCAECVDGAQRFAELVVDIAGFVPIRLQVQICHISHLIVMDPKLPHSNHYHNKSLKHEKMNTLR